MSKKIFFNYLVALLVLAGCATQDTIPPSNDWFDEYARMQPHTPEQMYGRPADGYGEYDTSNDTHTMAVLLPLSGPNAQIGKSIRTSTEIAILQNAPRGLNVSFYDTNENFADTASKVLNTNPEIIIGPLFADNAKHLRDTKPENTPILSFTSDAAALGNGVMTMNLMPTNSVESIVREIQTDGKKKFIIIAPDTKSGHLMAGTAKSASKIYEIPLAGIFFYTEGDPDSIKNAAIAASMNNARTTAHTRARQVLSDIITNEELSILEKSSLNYQLEKLAKTDTIGRIPYDAILFLGNGDDTKSLASYMRYYDIGARDASFYGTTMWDGSDIAYDLTMLGAKFATMPTPATEFSTLYEQTTGASPNRLATMGYDATNMAIGMLYSNKNHASYLLDPSGYIGTDGLIRLQPTGASERALRIVKIQGDGSLQEVKPAATNFLTPLYNIEQRHITPADEMELETPGVDPDNYINIPERLRSKYSSKTVGANMKYKPSVQKSKIIAFLPEDDSEPIKAENYTPIKLESVSRNYIEEYEIYED